MKGFHFLELLTTKYLVLTIVTITILSAGGFALVLAFGLTDVNSLSAFVDAVFKSVAVLGGTIWALNRYFVARTDITQLKVDPDVSIVRDTSFSNHGHALALLVFRLDVINTGKTLIPAYQQLLEIDSVRPAAEGIEYQQLHRWPSSGFHPGGPIEPNSWSAINSAISIPADVKVVRMYLEIQLSKGNTWTWHKTFDLSDRKSSHD